MSSDSKRVKGSSLVAIRGLKIEGFSDDKWHPIIKGMDLDLKRGEVLGLIGESGAGKSTLGLAAMGYTKPGCRISAGSIKFDGTELVNAPQEALRKMWGSKISYVAQSASASFNPAHRGHCAVALYALKALDLDWVWWLVSTEREADVSMGSWWRL